MPKEIEPLETADELKAQIRELQEKANKLEAAAAAAENAIELVEMPVANVRIKISKFQDNTVNNVTPAELTYLVAEHHVRAGGNPVLDIQPQGTVKRDPRHERARLCQRYNRDRVMKMFPGNEPLLPKSFKRAMESGIQSNNPGDGYFFKMPLVEASA